MPVEDNFAFLPSFCPGACGFVEEANSSNGWGLTTELDTLGCPPIDCSVSLRISSSLIYSLATSK
jgi:hypothetical protein